jgi:hypothetical protein
VGDADHAGGGSGDLLAVDLGDLFFVFSEGFELLNDLAVVAARVDFHAGPRPKKRIIKFLKNL